MISQGHLVQDWKGRVGIAIGRCEAPDREELDESLERVVHHWEGSLRWWRIALLSGSVVRSPEQATDSLGPVKHTLLEWAIKHADRSVADQLSSLSPPDPDEPRSS